MPDFQPFVPASDNRPEFTLRAVLLGSFFGIMFGAVTVYVGLRAGLTVAASIPIAVLSISILRAFGRSSILENIIVQTTGNAGQSIAAGVIFTLPALIFLGFDLEYSRIFHAGADWRLSGRAVYGAAAAAADCGGARDAEIP